MYFCDWAHVTVSRECNSTATFDVNVCCIAQYIEVDAPEVQLIECVLLHNTTI